jgi:hypothetical protein
MKNRGSFPLSREQISSAKTDSSRAHSVIADTVGYETKNLGYMNFTYLGEPILIGANNTYGTPTNFTSRTETIVDFHLTIKWSNLSDNEKVTVGVQALMANGVITSLEISRNGNSMKMIAQSLFSS